MIAGATIIPNITSNALYDNVGKDLCNEIKEFFAKQTIDIIIHEIPSEQVDIEQLLAVLPRKEEEDEKD